MFTNSHNQPEPLQLAYTFFYLFTEVLADPAVTARLADTKVNSRDRKMFSVRRSNELISNGLSET